MIQIYTDGSSRGNPGPGGYGVVLKYGSHRKELSEGFLKTTNNRMELMAVIVGLAAIKNPELPITVYSDSKYVIDSINKKWVFGWQKKGFAGKKNPDLWRKFLQVYKGKNVNFQWVKGHAGIPENERCDELAVDAAMSRDLKPDPGFSDD